jgi:hypothetical protein
MCIKDSNPPFRVTVKGKLNEELLLLCLVGQWMRTYVSQLILFRTFLSILIALLYFYDIKAHIHYIYLEGTMSLHCGYGLSRKIE